MHDDKPNPEIKNSKDNEYLPTEREFKRLLDRDNDVPMSATVANYSVYHRYNRGS